MKTRRKSSATQFNYLLVLTLLFTLTPASLLAQGHATAARSQYIQKASLWPELRDSVSRLGYRLQQPGRERMVLSGTLYRSWSSQTSNVRVTWELPGKLRIEDTNSGAADVSVSNGNFIQKSGGRAMNTRDNDLLETFLYDTPERFFLSQAEGMSIQPLGRRFRDLDATNAVYYDIYEVMDRVKRSQGARLQRKLYYINSTTRLMEKVSYSFTRGGANLFVVVKMSDWRGVNGEQIPGKVERFENGQLVMSLAISTSGTGPAQADGIFDMP